MFTLLLLFACASQQPATVGGPDCPACPDCAPSVVDEPDGIVLEPWEAKLLSPVVEELRGGVVPWGEQPFGVCEGKRDCSSYLGAEPGLLKPGNYFIRAEVKVPAVGEGWRASFSVRCTTSDAEGETSSQEHEKTYDIMYSGKDRAYRLQPLWKIQAPHTAGARSCEFSLVPIRPDGEAAGGWHGHYETPAPS